MHLLKGCKFFIYVAWSKDRKEYVLRTSKLEHNHAHGADLYPLYPSSRYDLFAGISVTFTLTYIRLLILNTRTAEYETSYKLIVKTGQTQ